MAIWNPIPSYNGRWQHPGYYSGRTPFVYAFSKDDGMTWSEPVVFEDDPDCGFCYPSIFFTDDNSVLTGYCGGSFAGGGDCLASSTIRKIGLV